MRATQLAVSFIEEANECIHRSSLHVRLRLHCLFSFLAFLKAAYMPIANALNSIDRRLPRKRSAEWTWRVGATYLQFTEALKCLLATIDPDRVGERNG
jgi:hypothetical protein